MVLNLIADPWRMNLCLQSLTSAKKKKKVWLEFLHEHVKLIRLTILLDLQGEKKHNFVFKMFTILVLQ